MPDFGYVCEGGPERGDGVGVLAVTRGRLRVRVAATVAESRPDTVIALRALLDHLGIPRVDQIIRPVAKQGAATRGVRLNGESLAPEITVAADGVYWHPVAASDKRALVRRQIEPLRPALDEIYRQFCDQWAHTQSRVTLFPCA